MPDFIIKKTNDHRQDVVECPVPGARQEEDIREWWKEDRRGYVITINTLDELLEIVDTQGKIVVLPAEEEHPQYKIIEIYNDYRE